MSLENLKNFMSEITEERAAQQAKRAKEQEEKQRTHEQLRLRKQRSDTWMIQDRSSSITDKHGRHHIKRWWTIVSLVTK